MASLATHLAEVLEERLRSAVFARDQDAHEGFCLVQPGLNCVDVALGRPTFSRWAKERARCDVKRELCAPDADTTREGKEDVRVPSNTQFLHCSEGLVRSHLHFDLRHWSHALLLRLRICFSPAFEDMPCSPLPEPFAPAPEYPPKLTTPDGNSCIGSSSPSS